MKTYKKRQIVHLQIDGYDELRKYIDTRFDEQTKLLNEILKKLNTMQLEWRLK